KPRKSASSSTAVSATAALVRRHSQGSRPRARRRKRACRRPAPDRSRIQADRGGLPARPSSGRTANAIGPIAVQLVDQYEKENVARAGFAPGRLTQIHPEKRTKR